ncbi:hypothetical protein LX36DRAFT_358907 [Colletotrichum falcatum]|nr:hypothetical protein LX36DRAFT_358907 [Colletotrichum falcatum]
MMEECHSVDYLGSLVTLCSTDKYQSVCLDDRKGHVSCNVTMGGPLSIARDLQDFFLPYGTVAWISSVVGIWIWVSLLNGKAPLSPNRAIKHKAFVYFGGAAHTSFLILTAIARVPRLKNRSLKMIAVGHVVAVVIVQSAVLSTTRKNTSGHKEPDKQDEDEETRDGESTKTTDQDEITRRPLVELARPTTSSASAAVSVAEKPGFLENMADNAPGTRRTATSLKDGEASAETPEKGQTAAEGLWYLLLGTICLSPGHIMMFCGAIGIARQIFAAGPDADARQQREVRDALALFGVIAGTGVVAAVARASTATAARPPHEESAAAGEAAGRKRAAENHAAREAAVFGAVVLGGVLGVWCQHFVLAAAAGDTHGVAHLGQTSNASLVYLVFSKLLLFAC